MNAPQPTERLTIAELVPDHLPGTILRSWLSLLEHGLAEPFLEPDLAELRLGGRNQPALAELGSEVPRVRVDDHLVCRRRPS